MFPVRTTTEAPRQRASIAEETSRDGVLERARRLASGAICAGVVHEFANLLTVIDGLEQITTLGIPWSDGHRLIHPPAERGQALVHSFRHFFAERATDGPVELGDEMRQLEAILRVRLRGRRTHLEVDAAEGTWIHGRAAPSLRMVLLLIALALVEPGRTRESDATALRFRFRRDGDDLAIVVRREGGDVPALRAPPSSIDEMLSLAGALGTCCGAEVRSSVSVADGAFELTVQLGGAMARPAAGP